METATFLSGATDGIGLELARLWLAQDRSTFVHGRRGLADLQAEFEPGLFDARNYVCADLANPEAVERVSLALNERGVEGLRRLVLNAGMGWWGPPSEQRAESIREVVQVNLLASMRLCRLLLPRLLRANGRIVYISSVASLLPCPDFAVYAAAKAAAEGFFRSLRIELEGRVEVQVLRPGAVRTALHAKCGVPSGALNTERFPTAASVARRIERLVEGPPTWRTLGAGNRAVGALGRNLPRMFERAQARRARVDAFVDANVGKGDAR